MMKTRLIAMMMASLVLFYTSCSEKEVPQPVEDTERTDALRAELRSLMVSVHGAEATNAILAANNELLQKNADELQAEVDALEAQYNATVSYQVVVIDFLGNPIPGATVTLNENGAVASKTSDANGVATFTDVRAGFLSAVVSATGWATANYTTSLYSANLGGVNSRIALLPKSGTQAEAGMFTYTGYLYANLNVANDSAGGVHSDFVNGQFANITNFAGTDPATKNAGPNDNFPHRTYDKQNKKLVFYADVDLNEVPFSESYQSSPGSIRNVAYEDADYVATFDANNKYTVKLPINSIYQGITFGFRAEAPEFTADETRISTGGAFTDGGPQFASDPTPKTFTQKRVYRFTPVTGLSSSGKIAGSVYTMDLYYNQGTID